MLARGFGIDAVEITLALSDRELGLTGLPPAFNASVANPGPSVEITATIAGQLQAWDARIERTSAAVDTQTRLLSAIAVVEKPFARPDAPLAPGLFINAGIDGVSFDNVLSVPREALRGDDEIYVADGEFLRMRTVDVVYTEPKLALIRSGLSETDKVIISPVQAPFDGMRIRVQQRPPNKAAEAPKVAAAAPSTSTN
jgi:multidrug efflux pump subunit AcrA (membrane-fusion protein)